MSEKLFQFECKKNFVLFYVQTSLTLQSSRRLVVKRCPVCGSKRIAETGITFKALNENKKQTA